MHRYRISIYWGEHSTSGIIVCDDSNAQSLKDRLLNHKGNFVEFNTEDGDFIRVRKSIIDALRVTMKS